MVEASQPATSADEEVIMTVRRHPIGLIPIFAAVGLVLAGLATGSYLLGRYRDQVAQSVSPGVLATVVFLLLVLTLLIGAVGYVIYVQNRLIITKDHLVQVTQTGLFTRTVSKLNMANVQDVSFKQNGLIPTLFNYGTLTIETAGEDDNFNFLFLPNPAPKVELISKLCHQSLEGSPTKQKTAT